MYALKNKVQLIGNLGNAPEIKTTEGGKKLARFSMATNESYRAGRKNYRNAMAQFDCMGQSGRHCRKVFS